MKKLAILFGITAIILSDVMCFVVAYHVCNLKWLGEYGGTSAPESVAFLYAIPFIFAIALCALLTVVFWKRSKTND